MPVVSRKLSPRFSHEFAKMSGLDHGSSTGAAPRPQTRLQPDQAWRRSPLVDSWRERFGRQEVTVDGVEQQNPVIPLADDRREHKVEVRLG